MRFSIWPSPARPWDEILELTRHCEATGWDGVYFADHFMPNGPDATPLDGDTIECWAHGSAFSLLSGKPLNLPAYEPVPVFAVVIDGDDVLIDLGEN